MSVYSLDYLESAERMLKVAKEEFNQGNVDSVISYLLSTQQDINNALFKAKYEKEAKRINDEYKLLDDNEDEERFQKLNQ